MAQEHHQDTDTDDAAEPPDLVAERNNWMRSSPVFVACALVVFANAIEPQSFSFLLKSNVESQMQIHFWSAFATLTLTVSILLGGALGDRYGRRRLFLIATTGMIAVCAISATTPSSLVFILALRVADGAFIGMIVPLAFAIMTIEFDLRVRPYVFAGLVAISALGGALARPLADLLGQETGSGLIYVPTIVVGFAGLILAQRHIRESWGVRSSRVLDWVFPAWVFALFVIVFAVIEALVLGYLSPLSAVLLGVGLILIMTIWYGQRSKLTVVTEGSPFPARYLGIGITAGLLIAFLQGGLMLQILNYFQWVLGYSIFLSGLGLVPFAIGAFLMASRVGPFTRRFPVRAVIAVGMLTMALAFLLLAFAITTKNYLAMIVPLLLFGSGFMLSDTPRLFVVMSTVSPKLVATASAVNSASVQFGSTLGFTLVNLLIILLGNPAALNQYVQNLGTDVPKFIVLLASLSGLVADQSVQIAEASFQIPNASTPQLMTNGLMATLLFLSGSTFILAVLVWTVFGRTGERPFHRLDDASNESPSHESGSATPDRLSTPMPGNLPPSITVVDEDRL